MAATIQFKRAKAATWVKKYPNYVLKAGEAGLETDTSKMKIGDGTRTWIELPYSDATQIMDDLDGITEENAHNYANVAASAKALYEQSERIKLIENIVAIDAGELRG